MVVARTQGPGSGFLKLELEPGWRLMRRQYGTRKLGHLYVYRQDWPSASGGSSPAVPGQDLAPMPAMQPTQGLVTPPQQLPVPSVAAPAVTAPSVAAPKVLPAQKPVQGQPVPGLSPVPPLTPPAQPPAVKKP
jgi:hypothetical protein